MSRLERGAPTMQRDFGGLERRLQRPPFGPLPGFSLTGLPRPGPVGGTGAPVAAARVAAGRTVGDADAADGAATGWLAAAVGAGAPEPAWSPVQAPISSRPTRSTPARPTA